MQPSQDWHSELGFHLKLGFSILLSLSQFGGLELRTTWNSWLVLSLGQPGIKAQLDLKFILGLGLSHLCTELELRS